ncbi:MAG TPA: DNA-binding response regulator [Flavobacteriales bacterium]|jgi:two-component system alkaline phosphatase synthesis response regulator PhoP|nr:response regulator transcription factor [Salibacteraceae bacterium]HAS35891.1 DNA-binding response regulator [Flavobacteriales bacterium]
MPDVKILLVDDEPDILEFIGYNLKKESFKVFKASNGKEAIEVAKKELPEVILLDVMMPEMDGIETCQELRQVEGLESALIVFLTARSEDYSQIAGLEAGADDYITKPVKPKVLLSKLKAMLRRKDSGKTKVSSQKIDGLVIDRDRYLVIKDGKELNLPKKEFELLSLLASSPGKVFNREKILSKVWGDDVVVGDRTIDVHIRKLREKIGEGFIKTIKGVGYKYKEH